MVINLIIDNNFRYNFEDMKFSDSMKDSDSPKVRLSHASLIAICIYLAYTGLLFNISISYGLATRIFYTTIMHRE